MAKTTTFGTSQAIKSPSPMWAKWVFRIALYLNAGATVYVSATSLLSPDAKQEIFLVLNAFVVPAIHLLSKSFGIKEGK